MCLAMLCIVASCKKEAVEDRGLTESNLDASFTLTPVAGKVNTFFAQVKDSSYILSKWDFGNGSVVVGKSSQEVFLPDAGVYTITHYAVGRGGATFSSSQNVTIATSDPARGNLVKGGKFETADDEAKWTRLTISAPAVTWTRSNGKMVASGGNWGHSAIYQAITVEANKDYRFAMQVSGSGATDTWFEVYFGTAAPVQNSDYSSGGIAIALNTWAGCGNTTFNGNIATIGCAGALVGQNGKIRFTQSGTVYLLIKTGGANLGTSGISIDNVELRGI
ncbi:MAG TPA: hypothetical protein VD993_00300 [Chitinophagaceae bacterium]|nr:hypothetical protein [Chitinophagaceae bacterium]